MASLPKALPRADRALSFNARLAKYADHRLAKVAPASVKRRVGHIQALLTYAFQKRWIQTNRVGYRASGLPRRQIAIISASVTSWAVMVSLIDQPTVRRENRSITTAAYSHPSAVEM